MSGSTPLAFGALLGGAIVLEYGIRKSRTAFSSSGSSGGTPSTGSLPDPSTSQGSVIHQAWAVLRAAGLNPVGASGVIGNALQESGWNPASVGDGGGGLWGFTSSPNSLSDLQAYAQSKGVAWTNPTVQTEFLVQHMSASDIRSLNSAGSPAAAASWFMNNWEHPLASSENEPRRQQGAAQAYKAITSGG